MITTEIEGSTKSAEMVTVAITDTEKEESLKKKKSDEEEEESDDIDDLTELILLAISEFMSSAMLMIRIRYFTNFA